MFAKHGELRSLVLFSVALILAMSYLLHRRCGPLSYARSLVKVVIYEVFWQPAGAGLVTIRGALVPGLTQGRLKH